MTAHADAARSARTAPPNNRVAPWMGFPSLLVTAVALEDGMHVVATLRQPWEGKSGRTDLLFRHVWRPAEVTELAIVEWASKALARWLEGQLLPETD